MGRLPTNRLGMVDWTRLAVDTEAVAARGVAIVMVSSELPEIIALSDRVLVMREGRVTAELSRAAATQERIMRHATRHTA